MKKLALVFTAAILSHMSQAQVCPSDCSNGTTIGTFTPNASLVGGGNIFVGDYAGASTTFGANNTFVGSIAGYQNLTGNNNTFLGFNAGNRNTQGSDNAIVGMDAGVNNTTGSANVIMGPSAGQSNTTGSYNVYMGRNAGRNNILGEYNTFLGYNSGYHSTGSRNLFLGHRAGESEVGNDMLHIASTPHTSLIKGDFSNQWVSIANNLGIGTDNPSQALEVVGNGIASQWLTYSDERLKKDMKVIQGAMDKVEKIDGLTYHLKVQTNPQHSPGISNRSYGVSAQTIKEVLPSLVQEDQQGLLSVNYNGLIPLLIEALKEKNGEIKMIKNELKKINLRLSKSL